MAQKETPTLNILMLGEAGVGKTSLINSFVGNKFEVNMVATIGVEMLQKVRAFLLLQFTKRRSQSMDLKSS